MGGPLCARYFLILALLGSCQVRADLGMLFFGGVKHLDPPSDLSFVGFVDGGADGVFAITRRQLESDAGSSVSIVALGDVIADGYIVDAITDSELVLKKRGLTVTLSMTNPGVQRPPFAQVEQSVDLGDGGSSAPIRKSAMGFNPDASSETVRALARVAGVPETIVDRFNLVLVKARSRSGRPGWSLDPMIDQLGSIGLPFLRGDILLGIDGFSVHDLDALKAHLGSKQPGDLYKVEIQRDGKLIMYEISR